MPQGLKQKTKGLKGKGFVDSIRGIVVLWIQ
jgi:hypothetical protein